MRRAERREPGASLGTTTSRRSWRAEGRSLAALLLAGLAPNASSAETLVGVTLAGTFVAFESEAPGEVREAGGGDPAGIGRAERLVAIDFQPGPGALYALGATGLLYIVDLGAERAFLTGGEARITPFSGTHFGLEFQPDGFMRIVSDADQNLRVEPDTGAVAAEAPLAYPLLDPGQKLLSNPRVVSLAASPDPGSRAIFAIDVERDALAVLGSPEPPSSGQLHTVGPLGLDATDAGGFDVSPDTGVAYAGLQVAGRSVTTLFEIDLATGAATPLGDVGGVPLAALAVQPAASATAAPPGSGEVEPGAGAPGVPGGEPGERGPSARAGCSAGPAQGSWVALALALGAGLLRARLRGRPRAGARRPRA